MLNSAMTTRYSIHGMEIICYFLYIYNYKLSLFFHLDRRLSLFRFTSYLFRPFPCVALVFALFERVLLAQLAGNVRWVCVMPR